MSFPIFLYLTVGTSGARGDFVAGWLSSLPWVINNEWTIDPVTGRSFGNQQLIRNIDKMPEINTSNLNECLLTHNWQLNPSAKCTYSGACHGFQISKQVTQDNLSSIKCIVIDTTDVDPITLHWEFCVKTYGSYDHRRHIFENNTPHYLLDHGEKNQLVTDQDRYELFKKQLLLTVPKSNWNPSVDFPHVTISYNDVISPHGSQKLTELLDINVDPAYHKLWEANLKLATTPDSINLFEKRWSKDMCT